MNPRPRARALGLILAAAVLAAAPGHAETGFVTDPALVNAGAYRLDPDHGKITWSISHLGFSTYRGQFTGVDAKLTADPKAPEKSTLTVTVAMDSVGTLNPELDKHLKSPEFFDVAKFPTATFKATEIAVTGKDTGTITGNLTLHGVTKPVTLQATFHQAGLFPMDKKYRMGFDAQATIKRSDFGIDAYLPLLGDTVTLDIEAEFVKAE
jgi:polyisoprenoid-binding protein YceI